MATPKSGTATNGEPMHYSVGAIIKQDDRYLLIDRVKPPFGMACIAGHIDEGENVQTALTREVEEESGLTLRAATPLFEEELDWNTCSKGITVHYWHVFQCEVDGILEHNVLETKSIGWYTLGELQQLELEPVWKYWFEKAGVLG